MTALGDERSLSEQRDQLLEDHRTIRELTEQIESAPDLVGLLQRLQELRSVLQAHFLAEEQPGGFFDVIRSRAARHVGRVEVLGKEHRTLLDQIDQLAERARACLRGPVADILKQARDLAREQRDHEKRENDLLMDSMYTDSGHGD